MSAMNTIRKLTLFITAFFSLGAVQAQTPISLSDALQYALANSEVLKQARTDIETVHQKVIETRAGALPQLNVSSSVTGNILVPQFIFPAAAMGGAPGEFVAIEAGQTWNAMSKVQLSQQLFNQQLFTGLKAAKSSVEFYKLQAQVSEENVMQQVAANFYQVLITREKMAVIDANIERATQLEKMIRGQYENGLAKKIDLDRVLVNKGNLSAQKLELTNAVSQQENLLKYYMGMPVEEKITLISNPLDKASVAATHEINTESLNVSDLLSYRTLGKQQDLYELQRKAIKAEAYPSLSLDANYTYNTQSNKFNLYTGSALNYDVSAVSLSLKIPIFDGFSRKARAKQVSFDIEKGNYEMAKTKNNLQMNYTNAIKQIAYSKEAIKAQKANEELAQEVFNSTQNNYKNGLASLTDLLDAESELVTAQNSYNEALLNFKVAEIELIKSKGEIKSLLNL